MPDSESHVHLVVLVHGLWGNPAHLAELKRHLLQKWQMESSIELLVASSTSDDLTYDGIDWGAERVAKEVVDRIRDVEEQGRIVTKFSTIGYSLGGLVCRFLIGILYRKGYLHNGSMSSSHRMKALNFVTIATPHLGMPHYPGLLPSLSSAVGGHLLSRTGRQLCLLDSWRKGGMTRDVSDERPLLEFMADPSVLFAPRLVIQVLNAAPDQIFYKAFSMFENVAIYANAVNDVTVPYTTGAIELDDPFHADEALHIKAELDEEYSPILKSWSILTQPNSRRLRKQTILPPYLRFDFPHNMLIYPLLPLLAPMAISAAVITLGISSRKSRARIHALEKDVSFAEALWHSVEDLQTDARVSKTGTGELSVAVDIPGPISSETMVADPVPLTKAVSRKLPSLDDKQIAICRFLNGLPRLQKFLVWIHPIRNSHAHIICRDIEKFSSQCIGEGVLRHVADHLLI